jgi:hypothetical protein
VRGRVLQPRSTQERRTTHPERRPDRPFDPPRTIRHLGVSPGATTMGAVMSASGLAGNARDGSAEGDASCIRDPTADELDRLAGAFSSGPDIDGQRLQ